MEKMCFLSRGFSSSFHFFLFKDSFEILPWETPISSSRILMVMMFIIKGKKSTKFLYIEYHTH